MRLLSLAVQWTSLGQHLFHFRGGEPIHVKSWRNTIRRHSGSRAVFVATANVLDTVPGQVVDRMGAISLPEGRSSRSRPAGAPRGATNTEEARPPAVTARPAERGRIHSANS
jgi:hypothetical protein